MQALDSRVERDGLGKEKKYPVILSAKEKKETKLNQLSLESNMYRL